MTILLHYFFMAAFCWMLSEGMLLFIMLNFVLYKGFFISKSFFLQLGGVSKVFVYNKLHTYIVHICMCMGMS